MGDPRLVEGNDWTTMTLQTLSLSDGETIAFITLYGVNRHHEVISWHRRVMVDHFDLPINYIECPFAQGASHGQMMNHVLNWIMAMPYEVRPTYLWWIDNDCLFLRRRVVEDVIDIVRNKQTVWGQAWRNSHKAKPRPGDHPYASQACLCFATELYEALGKPDCDHHNARSDTAEEITYAAEAQGYTVALQWPTHSDTHTTELGQVSSYGRGNVYRDSYHESRADLEGHVERFVVMAKRVIAGEFDG